MANSHIFRIGAGLVAAAAACWLATAPAMGEERETGGRTILDEAEPDAVLNALERAGYEAEITKAKDGDPKIESTDDDSPFAVNFYDCNDKHEQCAYVQITQGWNLKKGLDLAKIDSWNADNVWGQAYRDDEKDPWLALVINFKGGVTPEYVDDMVEWWSVIVDDFEKHIGWDKD
ncbi:MAG TPA: YbjN domain-containing protein [Bauldia sp.]|nr:YbjN domain-containing protein [Bauldia sp.]